MTRHIPALTSLRCLAALMVFVFHWLWRQGRRHFVEGGQLQSDGFLYQVLTDGQFGVAVFFVLSGFLLTARYVDTLFVTTNLKVYFVKRFARIMPLYLLLCLAFMVITFNTTGRHQTDGKHEWVHYIVYFTLTQSWFEKLRFGNIGVAWSLTVEETFYMALPLLILALRAAMVERLPRWGRLLAGAAVIGAFGFAFLQLGRRLEKLEIELWGFMGSAGHWRAYTLCGRFFEFGFGAGMALLYLRAGPWLLERGALCDALIVAGTVTIVCVFGFSDPSYGMLGKKGWRINMGMAAVAAVVIYALCSEGSRIAQLLGAWLLVYAGKISYALYLIHEDIIDLTRPWLEGAGAATPWYVELPVLYLICSLAAALLYELIERPGQRLVLRLAGIAKPGASEPEPTEGEACDELLAPNTEEP